MSDNKTQYLTGAALVRAGALFGASLIICACIGAYTVLSVKSQGQTIRVTGAAYKPIRSDLAVWSAEISASAPTIEAGYAELKGDVEAVKSFLTTKEFGADDYTLSPVSISKSYNRDRVLVGFNLSRTVQLEQTNVDAISRLAEEASSLIEKGVMIQSRPIRYLFTKLDNLKLQMIEAATKNAQERAERLAATTGHSVGAPTSARVGVFQIRALRSQEVSSRGISDIYSIDKEIVSTVHIDFVIE